MSIKTNSSLVHSESPFLTDTGQGAGRGRHREGRGGEPVDIHAEHCQGTCYLDLLTVPVYFEMNYCYNCI